MDTNNPFLDLIRKPMSINPVQRKMFKESGEQKS